MSQLLGKAGARGREDPAPATQVIARCGMRRWELHTCGRVQENVEVATTTSCCSREQCGGTTPPCTPLMVLSTPLEGDSVLHVHVARTWFDQCGRREDKREATRPMGRRMNDDGGREPREAKASADREASA